MKQLLLKYKLKFIIVPFLISSNQQMEIRHTVLPSYIYMLT